MTITVTKTIEEQARDLFHVVMAAGYDHTETARIGIIAEALRAAKADGMDEAAIISDKCLVFDKDAWKIRAAAQKVRGE